MPQETELQIDDGTKLTALRLQCATCDEGAYLVRGATTTVKTTLGEVSEYPFTCTTPGCGTRVTVRVPQDGAK